MKGFRKLKEDELESAVNEEEREEEGAPLTTAASEKEEKCQFQQQDEERKADEVSTERSPEEAGAKRRSEVEKISGEREWEMVCVDPKVRKQLPVGLLHSTLGLKLLAEHLRCGRIHMVPYRVDGIFSCRQSYTWR